MKLLLTLIFLSIALVCYLITSTSDRIILQKTDFKYLKNFDSANLESSLTALNLSCSKYESSEHPIFKDNLKVWQDICDDLSANKEFFSRNFNIYKIHSKFSDKGLFTGYYEIELNGSLKKTAKFKYPIYTKPSDEALLALTREDITNGALENKDMELVYVDDYAKLFFLHIQGSGKIKLNDKNYLNVGFAGKNLSEYYSIGKYFIEKGIFNRENISALKIMKWLQENPDDAFKIMNMNPSYIFFEKREQSATGSLGVPLTANASLAVDRSNIPLGLPLYLETKLPDGKDFSNILSAQDTGSAIKGIVRGDIFFGSGALAENLASDMKNPGKLYLLLPKSINPDSYF